MFEASSQNKEGGMWCWLRLQVLVSPPIPVPDFPKATVHSPIYVSWSYPLVMSKQLLKITGPWSSANQRTKWAMFHSYFDITRGYPLYSSISSNPHRLRMNIVHIVYGPLCILLIFIINHHHYSLCQLCSLSTILKNEFITIVWMIGDFLKINYYNL